MFRKLIQGHGEFLIQEAERFEEQENKLFEERDQLSEKTNKTSASIKSLLQSFKDLPMYHNIKKEEDRRLKTLKKYLLDYKQYMQRDSNISYLIGIQEAYKTIYLDQLKKHLKDNL